MGLVGSNSLPLPPRPASNFFFSFPLEMWENKSGALGASQRISERRNVGFSFFFLLVFSSS